MVATKASELEAMNWPDKTEPSCLSKAAMDEPIFILRAQDQLSTAVVRRWADLLEAGSHPDDTPRREKVREARAWAQAAEEWREAHGGGKVPD